MLAVLPPMGLDVGGGGKVSKDQTASSEFSAAGERIWALQYRQIKFKWYSSKKLKNAALETGTRWVTFGRSAHSQVMWSGSRDDSNDLLGDSITGETLVEDTEDMVEAFIDDELDLEDQFDVQNTNGETLFIPRQAGNWVSDFPSISKMARQAKSWVIPLPPHLRTAADDPEEDVQLSSEASIIERAEHLE